MKGKQLLLLFLALLLPTCIFVFLKMFGRNEFDVAPLFTETLPASTSECGLTYTFPYQVPDTVMATVLKDSDSLALVVFKRELPSTLKRVAEKYQTELITWNYIKPEDNSFLQRCIFASSEPFDVALVDRRGRIRGQYNSSDRDEVDRLLTEIAILLKKY